MQEPATNHDLISSLDHISHRAAGYQEGNLYHLGGRNLDLDYHPGFLAKRCAWAELCQQYQYCIEVGVNAGHSAVLALESRPDLHYTGIDVCIHRYTRLCAEVLSHHYGSRFQFHRGGSSLWLKRVSRALEPTLFSIDGDHSRRQLEIDLALLTPRLIPGDTVWIDDTDRPELALVVREYFPMAEFHDLWAVASIRS